jgi:tight adherence protein B
MLIALLAAVAVGLAIGMFAMYLMRSSGPRPADRRLQRLAERPKTERRLLSWEEIRRRGPSSLPFLSTLLQDSEWSKRTAKEIEQSGIRLRVSEYAMMRLGGAAAGFFGVWILFRTPVAIVPAIIAAIAGYMLPKIWISVLRTRRIGKINKQMPEAVGMLANALRAGFAFQHGIDLVANQMQEPISDEFARVIADLNVGATVEEALTGMLERADSEDVNLMVTAVLIQRTSGGNLAEILETVGESMRERERLVGEVRTMTSQQRFSGTVLTFWPLLLLAIFAAVNWKQTSLLFTTNIGLVLISIGAVMQLLGYFTIRRILDVDI